MSGKLHIPHCLGPPSCNGYLVHRSKVGSIVAGCIGAHLARGKVKSVEHELSWSLDSKQLPLPLPLSFQTRKHREGEDLCRATSFNNDTLHFYVEVIIIRQYQASDYHSMQKVPYHCMVGYIKEKSLTKKGRRHSA